MDTPSAQEPNKSFCHLYQGDCLNILLNLASVKADLVCADLPYASTENAWDSAIDMAQFWKATRAVSSLTKVYVLFSAQPFTTSLICSNPKKFRYDLIFRKTTPVGFLNAKKMPLRLHEHLLVFYDKLPTYNPQKWQGPIAYKSRERSGSNSSYGKKGVTIRAANDGSRFPVSVLDFKSINRQKVVHPTQKPVALLEWIISTYTNIGDTVLDPVFGSGTTAVACARLGRNFIGIEKDPDYFRIGHERVDAERKALGLSPSTVNL